MEILGQSLMSLSAVSCILNTDEAGIIILSECDTDWHSLTTFLCTFDFLLFSPPGKIGEGLFSALVQLGSQDCQSSQCTQKLTLPPPVDPALKALQLTEALRAVLEGQGSEEEQTSLRKEVSTDTANIILKWLQRTEVSTASCTCEGLPHLDIDGWQVIKPSVRIRNPLWKIQNPLFKNRFC